MKRALLIVLALLAAGAGLAVLVLNPAGRSDTEPEHWDGWVIPLHLPKDVGLQSGKDGEPPPPPERAWPGGPYLSRVREEEVFVEELSDDAEAKAQPAAPAPPPAPLVPRLTIQADGTLYFHAIKLGTVEEGGLEKLDAKISEAVAAGTKEFDLDAESGGTAELPLRVLALCHARGSWGPGISAAFPDAPESKAALGPITGYTPPKLMRIAHPFHHPMPHGAFVTLVLDPRGPLMVLRRHGKPDEVVNGKRLPARLKALAATMPSKDNPQLSDLTVVVHLGEGAGWDWLSWVLMECAKVGIWRIEAAVQSPTDR